MSELPFSIEAAVNGHSFTVSGPDRDWVERVAKETFESTKPTRDDRQRVGFTANSNSVVERADERHPSGWIGVGGPAVVVSP